MDSPLASLAAASSYMSVCLSLSLTLSRSRSRSRIQHSRLAAAQHVNAKLNNEDDDLMSVRLLS